MPEPPIMRKKRDHGRKAEARAGKRTNSQVHPGSGAIDGLKADLTKGSFKVESKATVHRSLSVKKEWLDKVDREARAVGKTPALMIQFVDARGEVDRNGSWVCIPEHAWVEIAE